MRLSFKTKIAYGLPGIGDSALYNLIETFLLLFMTTVVGLKPAVAGTIAAVGSVWETIWGAVMGYMSDNTQTRYGKRKPYLLAAAFPLALFSTMLFTVIDAGGAFRVFYYGLTLILFWTGFNTFFVPYLAWGAELTQDYNERTVLRGYTYIFNDLGMVIGMILPTVIVDALTRWGRSEADSWQLTALFCSLFAALSIFAGALMIHDRYEREYRQEDKPRTHKSFSGFLPAVRKIAAAAADMLRNYWQILKLRAIRCILGASVFYLIAYAVFCADRMYFLTYNMRLSASQISLIMALMTFASVIFVPFVTKAGDRFDKRTLFIAGMSISAAGMGAFGIIGISGIAGIVVFTFFYSIGSIVYWQLIPAMIYDVCEVDQLINNRERAGLVISLQSISESIANAVGLQLLGIILQLARFNGEAAAQSPFTLLWTNMSFTIIPAVFMALSVFMIVRYPVTKEVYERVLEALDKRRRGEEVDMTPFRSLGRLR